MVVMAALAVLLVLVLLSGKAGELLDEIPRVGAFL